MSATITPKRIDDLPPLPPEPWGRRLKRAREDVAQVSLDAAASALSAYIFVSGPTLSRLESRTIAPIDRRQRGTAYLACVGYGVNPAELGLTAEDLPPGIPLNISLMAGIRRRNTRMGADSEPDSLDRRRPRKGPSTGPSSIWEVACSGRSAGHLALLKDAA